MSRSKGRRYNGEQKLNLKKVFAVIMVLVVIIMFVFVIRALLTRQRGETITSASYFTSFENQKYGVIDNQGTSIIEPSYGEYIVIPNEKKDVFLCTYDVDYANNTYKTKVLNAKNEEIFKEYEQVQALDNLDIQNNVYYEDQALKIKKNGKYGLLDLAGKEILPCEYDNIWALPGTTNSIVIEKEGKVGLVDSKASVVIPNEYIKIEAFDKDYKAGYLVQKEDKKYGLVDVTHQIILDAKYDQIKKVTDNNQYIVKEDGNWKVVTKEGTTVVEGKYDAILTVRKEEVIVQKGSKVGVINTKQEEILPISYESIDFCFDDHFIVKNNGKYGIVNKENKTIVETSYESIRYLKEGDFVIATKQDATSDIISKDGTVKLNGIITQINIEKGYFRMRIGEEYHYYNFKLEEKKNTQLLTANTLFLIKQDGKYGYIDKEGKIVVEPIYEEATEQNVYGYVAVKKDGKWGCLDKTGAIVAQIDRILDDYLKIDFIGNWHLAKDLNLQLYTK